MKAGEDKGVEDFARMIFINWIIVTIRRISVILID
jgi:hypothetical protein